MEYWSLEWDVYFGSDSLIWSPETMIQSFMEKLNMPPEKVITMVLVNSKISILF